ncbi:serine/threonine protein kinase [Vibrio cincinnatiensis]|uniref:serine/threonine-protein kinase n=1 Tax=Vibrio cincinnatiensis TaxID=675 RepID=UPI001EDD8FD7|nr:serine/threonine-protein kinase [Vibrio cincinnatiensis]MCG3761976.1 serine/threonine protein kinase [Vibrio cincinnatiensis]
MPIDKNENKDRPIMINGDKTQIIRNQTLNQEDINPKNQEEKKLGMDKKKNISQSSDSDIKKSPTPETKAFDIEANDKNDFKNQTTEKNSNDLVEHSTLTPGHVVKGRYIIDALIGHGGLCDVYRAKDKVLESSGAHNPYVALKILQSEYIDQPETARMLIREAQHTQTLSHPNIIRVFDFGVDNKTYFIVMEYLDGETVEQLIQRSRPSGLPFHKAKIIFNQILDALIYAHSLDIVHADLKPANIMIESNGNVKILDFGVSKMEKLKQDQYAAKRKSDDNSVMGYTPNYASLNILAGNKPTREDDLFAFACIAYELVSCKHPYNRTTADIALKKALNLTKPASLPFLAWQPLKRILSCSKSSTPLSAKELKQRLNHTITPKFAVAISATLWLTTVVLLVNHYDHKLSTANHTTEQLATQLNYQQALLEASPEHVLTLTHTENLQPIVRDGLLRYHQVALLSYFETQIDEILNANEMEYPDYNKVESVLKNAATYYPDSHRLEILNIDIRSSKRSTLLTIERQINSALEKAHYTSLEGEKSVTELYENLSAIHTDYPFEPSSLASEVFGKNLKQALAQRDALSLNTLINIGNTFFTSSERHKEDLSISNQMRDAIEEMSAYLTEQENGNVLDYPYAAARVLYKNELESLYRRIRNASTLNALDKLVIDIDKLATELPSDFSDISDLRFQASDKYLKLSDILLKNREAVNARRAIQKANALLRQIDRS